MASIATHSCLPITIVWMTLLVCLVSNGVSKPISISNKLNNWIATYQSKSKIPPQPTLNQSITENRPRRNYHKTKWVLGQISSCGHLSPALRDICSVSYKTPSLYLHRSEYLARIINQKLKALQRYLSIKCNLIWARYLCSSLIPRCSLDHSMVDFPVGKSCHQVKQCLSQAGLRYLGRQMVCPISDGPKYNFTYCIRYNSLNINKKYCDPLPSGVTFPTWMADFKAQQNNHRNLDLQMAKILNYDLSSSCLRKWKWIFCHSLPFCSSNGKDIVTFIDQEQCKQAMDCLPPSLKRNFQRNQICSFYPKPNKISDQFYDNHSQVSQSSPSLIQNTDMTQEIISQQQLSSQKHLTRDSYLSYLEMTVSLSSVDHFPQIKQSSIADQTINQMKSTRNVVSTFSHHDTSTSINVDIYIEEMQTPSELAYKSTTDKIALIDSQHFKLVTIVPSSVFASLSLNEGEMLRYSQSAVKNSVEHNTAIDHQVEIERKQTPLQLFDQSTNDIEATLTTHQLGIIEATSTSTSISLSFYEEDIFHHFESISEITTENKVIIHTLDHQVNSEELQIPLKLPDPSLTTYLTDAVPISNFKTMKDSKSSSSPDQISFISQSLLNTHHSLDENKVDITSESLADIFDYLEFYPPASLISTTEIASFNSQNINGNSMDAERNSNNQAGYDMNHSAMQTHSTILLSINASPSSLHESLSTDYTSFIFGEDRTTSVDLPLSDDILSFINLQSKGSKLISDVTVTTDLDFNGESTKGHEFPYDLTMTFDDGNEPAIVESNTGQLQQSASWSNTLFKFSTNENTQGEHYLQLTKPTGELYDISKADQTLIEGLQHEPSSQISPSYLLKSIVASTEQSISNQNIPTSDNPLSQKSSTDFIASSVDNEDHFEDWPRDDTIANIFILNSKKLWPIFKYMILTHQQDEGTRMSDTSSGLNSSPDLLINSQQVIGDNIIVKLTPESENGGKIHMPTGITRSKSKLPQDLEVSKDDQLLAIETVLDSKSAVTDKKLTQTWYSSYKNSNRKSVERHSVISTSIKINQDHISQMDSNSHTLEVPIYMSSQYTTSTLTSIIDCNGRAENDLFLTLWAVDDDIEVISKPDSQSVPLELSATTNLLHEEDLAAQVKVPTVIQSTTVTMTRRTLIIPCTDENSGTCSIYANCGVIIAAIWFWLIL